MNEPFELTAEEIAELKVADWPVTDKCSYERSVAQAAQRKLVKYLEEPCTDHGTESPNRFDCYYCAQRLEAALGEKK
jgi:hypothetical protein